MKTNDYCSQCSHKDTCKEVYAKLGRYKGPSVAWDVMIAFGLPIAVFIAGSAACQRLLNTFLNENALILASFAGGCVLTICFAAAVRMIRRRFHKRGCQDGAADSDSGRLQD